MIMKPNNTLLIIAASILMIVSCKSKKEVGVSPQDQGEVLIEQYFLDQSIFLIKKHLELMLLEKVQAK